MKKVEEIVAQGCLNKKRDLVIMLKYTENKIVSPFLLSEYIKENVRSIT